MTLSQFLIILRGRRVLLGSILGGIVALTLVASLVLPKKYTATAAVVVDVKSPDPISGTMLHAMVMPGYMATQRDIITSERVADRAAQLLQVEARGLQKKLDVKPSRESNVIEISYRASDPAFAAAAANAFAQAYIDASIELRVEPARQYARWFGEQDQTLRANLDKAQARFAAHQQKYGIVATEERLDSELTRLNDLSARLTAMQAQAAEARSKRLMGGAAASLPEVVQNPLITTLKGDIARQEARLQDLAGNLGKNHPQYRRMEAELASLRNRLEAETRIIASGFGIEAAASKDKEAELAAAVAAQKTKVLGIRQAREQLAALQRDLDIAQKAYESVTQRLVQSQLESQVAQTNVSILAPARPPTEPSFPNLLLNLVAGIVLGTFGALGAVLVLELVDRRVRSAQDVEEMLQMPVLGVVPR
ncbi:MAG TPA: GNVR domain-containing protein [Burkholderiales bacterium]|nr:GNVR domain-containing protein [Burkholderiales bacterium]